MIPDAPGFIRSNNAVLGACLPLLLRSGELFNQALKLLDGLLEGLHAHNGALLTIGLAKYLNIECRQLYIEIGKNPNTYFGLRSGV